MVPLDLSWKVLPEDLGTDAMTINFYIVKSSKINNLCSRINELGQKENSCMRAFNVF